MSSQPAFRPSSLASTDQDVRLRACSISSISTASDADWEFLGPLSAQMSPFEEVPSMSSTWVKDVQNLTLSSIPKSSGTAIAKTHAFVKTQHADLQPSSPDTPSTALKEAKVFFTESTDAIVLSRSENKARVHSKESSASRMPPTIAELKTKKIMPQSLVKQQVFPDVLDAAPNKHQAISKQPYNCTLPPYRVTDPKLWQELVKQDQRQNPNQQLVTRIRAAERQERLTQQYRILKHEHNDLKHSKETKGQREAYARLNRTAANLPNEPSPGRSSADIARQLAALGSHIHSGQGSISESQLLHREKLIIECQRQRLLERDDDVLLNRAPTKTSNSPGATMSSTNSNLARVQHTAQNVEQNRRSMIARTRGNTRCGTRCNKEATLTRAQGNDEAKKLMLEQSEASITRIKALPTTAVSVSQDQPIWRTTAALRGFPPISTIDVSQGQHPHLSRRGAVSNKISTYDTLIQEGTGVRAEIGRAKGEIQR